MPRKIPMSPHDAFAAGLLDPEIARSLGLDVAAPAEPATGVPARAQGRKKKTRRSRPSGDSLAEVMANSRSGIESDGEGRVVAAWFDFALRPVPKERAQVVRTGAGARAAGYTPARTRVFSSMVSQVVRTTMGNHAPIAQPVALQMVFAMPVAKSWPKWRLGAAVRGLIAPTGRPDMDNLEKALLDAFNGTLFVDDALVVDRHARKVYAECPSIRVRARVTGQGCLGVSQAELQACIPPPDLLAWTD